MKTNMSDPFADAYQDDRSQGKKKKLLQKFAFRSISKLFQ